MGDIVKFDPKAYVDTIRARIRGAIVDVIPDEQWDEMIKAEMDRFMTAVPVRHDYNGNRIPESLSGAQQVIRDLVAADIKKRVLELLAAPEWSARWDGEKQVAGEKIGELMAKHGAEVLNSWLTNSMGQVVQMMRTQGMR